MDGTTDPIRRYHPEVSLVPGHLQPFITVVVLISGVVGGLILVISVILICKYCFKQKKSLKRRSRRRPKECTDRTKLACTNERKPAAYLSSAEEGASPFVSKYDSTEPSEIQNLYTADYEKDIENGNVEVEKNVEDEEENIDYYFQQYQEMLKDGNGNPVESCCDELETPKDLEPATPSPSPSRTAPTPRSSIVSAPASGPPSPPRESENGLTQPPSPPPLPTQVRRVSFQDEEHLKRRALCASGPPRRPPFDRIRLPRGRSYDVSDPPSLVRNWSFRRDSKKKSPMYTDGDYHYLKRMRVQRPPGVAISNPLFRQYSVGGLASSNSMKVQERYIRSMTDDPTYHHSTVHYDVPPSETTSLVPRRDSHREPSPHCSPMLQQKVNKTEVRALVHRSSTSNSSLEAKSSPPERTKRANPPKNLALYPVSARHSFSVEAVGLVDVASLGRRVKSYDYGLRDDHDYETSNLIQFDKGPFYNADFDVVSEGGGSPNFRSKVRYNDTGSLEEITGDAAKVMLNEIISDIHMSDPQDDTETVNGAQKYRDIWSLRATLEEEEDFSDTIRIEDMSSPEPSPEHERALSTYTTSFESNTEPCPYGDLTDSELASRNHLHPHHENRRQNYKSVLSRRFRRIEGRPPAGENSFDSVETMDTDGDVSDTSRPVDTTTSFESTTDNTDSTGDSQTHKLQQMKHDSGYRSLESTQPKPNKKQIQFVVEQDSADCDELEGAMSDKSPVDLRVVESHVKRARNSRDGQMERRNGRTASKKRREFSRERQLVQVYESINEPGTDSRSDLPSGDSFDDPATPSKFSVFSRFFKSHHKDRVRLTRDYSIDEKTNRIFNEFLRPDQGVAPPRVRSPRTRRLQRKFTDPGAEYLEYPRNKLCPEMRSTSLGSDSSCASSRRLSPQDSMDDDLFNRDLLTKTAYETRLIQADVVTQAGVAKQDIPIIRLPEEEISDV